MQHSAGDGEDQQTLIDRFGRKVNYLRISVTDRCDLRCVYCMSENMKFLPRASLLSLEEIIQVGQAFVDMGTRKIRITGGEPLHRRDILKVFRAFGELDGLDDLTVTTNGTQLPRFATDLRAAGVTRINVSLDSLRPERYTALTRNGRIERVLRGLDAAQAAGFDRIKLNAVILKNRNHDEIHDLVAFAIDRGIDISFIEEMPLGVVGDHDRSECYYSSDEIRRDLEAHYQLLPTAETTGGPSRYFRIPGVEYPGRLHLAAQPQLLRTVQPCAPDLGGAPAAVPRPGAQRRPAARGAWQPG